MSRCKNEHRKGEGAASIESAPRSGWFDDETFEITADTATSGKVRLPAISEALGNGLSEMPWLHREVYLDNRAEGESKLEGTRQKFIQLERGLRRKKLLKG